MKKNAILCACVFAAIVFGCYTGPDLDATNAPPPVTPPATAAPVSASGLPCDVADILVRRCGECHGDLPRRGAKSSVTKRAALLAAWEGSPSLGQACIDRMRDAKSPMPPEGLLVENEIAIVASWVAAGMPEGSCTTNSTAPADAPLKCTSARFWTEDDDEGSVLMTPGRACITCHDLENAKHDKKKKDGDHDDDDDDDDEPEAPVFSAAGTVYPTLREPDDCFGVGSLDTTVILEGADGKTTTLAVNRAGNFMSELAIAKPYRAKVVRGGKERAMKTAQTNGDCNTCHAADAKDAPGRILAP